MTAGVVGSTACPVDGGGCCGDTEPGCWYEATECVECTGGGQTAYAPCDEFSPGDIVKAGTCYEVTATQVEELPDGAIVLGGPTFDGTCEECCEPRGACCFPDGTCEDDTTEDGCVENGGQWHEDEECEEIDCPGLCEDCDDCPSSILAEWEAQAYMFLDTPNQDCPDEMACDFHDGTFLLTRNGCGYFGNGNTGEVGCSDVCTMDNSLGFSYQAELDCFANADPPEHPNPGWYLDGFVAFLGGCIGLPFCFYSLYTVMTNDPPQFAGDGLCPGSATIEGHATNQPSMYWRITV